MCVCCVCICANTRVEEETAARQRCRGEKSTNCLSYFFLQLKFSKKIIHFKWIVKQNRFHRVMCAALHHLPIKCYDICTMIFFCVVYGEICISLRLSILCIIIIIINIEARIEECAAALERFIQLTGWLVYRFDCQVILPITDLCCRNSH